MKRVARRVAAWTLFLLLPFCVLWKFAPIVSKTTIGNDYVVYPLDGQLEFIWCWSKGMVPLFIPGFDGGNTPAAMTLGQAWHPITWLCALVPWYTTGSAEVVVTFFRFLELGITHGIVYRGSRESGLRRTSSFVLSFAVVFNARMLDSFRYGASLEGYCGMLIACAAFASAFREGWTIKRVTLAAFAVYLTLVSGHPQWALFATTGAGLFALCLPLVRSQLAALPVVRIPWWKYIGGLAVACTAGVVLSTGYLLPFLLEFMPQNGDRVNQEYAFTLGYGDTVRGTLSNFFRPLEADVHGAFGGSVLFLALVLAIPVVLATRRRFGAGVLAPTLLFAIAILFSMGKATPVHHFMVSHLPLFSSFRSPGRANLWLPPMLLLIGWIVLADLDRADLARSWMRVPAIAVGGAFAVIGLVVFHYVAFGQRVGDSVPSDLIRMPRLAAPTVFALFGVGAAMLAFLASRARLTRGVAWGLFIGSMLWSAAITLPYGTWAAARKPSRTLAAIDAHHRKSLSFWGDAGFGLGTRIVAKATTAGIPVKRELGAVFEEASFATSDEATKKVKAGLPMNTVVLTGDEVPIPSSDATAAPRSRTKSVNWNRWDFTVTAPRGGVFVFGQPALAQWRAYVDGKPSPVLTANAVFASVIVSPGEHDVEFRYESKATSLGGTLFFLTLALLVAANAWVLQRRATRRRTRIAWLAGAAVTVIAIGFAGVSWHRCLSPDLNLVAPPAKVALKKADG